jgi:hypothetical protein
MINPLKGPICDANNYREPLLDQYLPDLKKLFGENPVFTCETNGI